MSKEKEALDYFGEFLMNNHRDKALLTLQNALKGQWKAKSFEEFQTLLLRLPKEQQDILLKGFELIITGALHDLLFGLQEENHFVDRIRIFVDGFDVVQISDGIHGEQFTEDGWIAKFSKYKESR